MNAVSTDLNGDNLIYKLYVNGTLKSTSASTTSGTSTKLTVTGLSEYTGYNYYVSVSDGMETAQSSSASVRTYCSGKTYSSWETCNREKVNCTNCNGVGESYNPMCTHTFADMSLYDTEHQCLSCWEELGEYQRYICEEHNICYADLPPHGCSNCGEQDHYWCKKCGGTGSTYKCSTHNVETGWSCIPHCSHGYTSQHD